MVLGPNGAGKTTFLESIHLLIRGRSFRPGLLKSLISFDAAELLVTAVGCNDSGEFRLGLSKSRTDNVRMRLNGADIRQISQIAALVPTQTFLPDLSALVFGNPAIRRSWLNWSVFHTHQHFMKLHRKYLRLLQQRNRAIQRRSSDLNIWTEQYVKTAMEVTAIREAHLMGLRNCFQRTLSSFAPDLLVAIDYDQGWGDQSLMESLANDAIREQKYGHTRLGPHRADVVLRVHNPNGDNLGPASRILSRGQGKTVACAMKLAQLDYLQIHGVNCTVLLDDITSELDENYTRRFFELLNATCCQVIATLTKNDTLIRAGLPSERPINLIQLEAGRIVNAKRIICDGST